MRIKLDENVPVELAAGLIVREHEVDSVIGEGLAGRPDHEIWEAAQREGRFLITQDLDFSDSRVFAPGSHHGLLLLRLRAPSRRSLIERAGELFRSEDVEAWKGCFVVATEKKVRVRRPLQPGR